MIKYTIYSDIQRLEAIRLYNENHIGGRNISKLINVPKSTIENWIYYDVKTKGESKININERFFDKWSYEMAYILGFIYADGCLFINKKKHGAYIMITSKDKEILININKVIESEHKISQCRTWWTISWPSIYIFKSLKKYGLTQRKSLIVRFPNVPKKYFWSFFRGVLDGDGWVSVQRNYYKDKIYKYLQVGISSGSLKFIKVLSNILKARYSINNTIYSNNDIHALYINRKRDCRKVFSNIYYNAPYGLFLQRKKDKFLEMIN